MEGEYAKMLLNLGIVLSLIMTAAYLLRKFRFAKFSQNNAIKIINSVSIGAKEKIILLSVQDNLLLVGATHHSIQTLYVFDQAGSFEQNFSNLNAKESFSEAMAELSNVNKENLN